MCQLIEKCISTCKIILFQWLLQQELLCLVFPSFVEVIHIQPMHLILRFFQYSNFLVNISVFSRRTWTSWFRFLLQKELKVPKSANFDRYLNSCVPLRAVSTGATGTTAVKLKNSDTLNTIQSQIRGGERFVHHIDWVAPKKNYHCSLKWVAKKK